MGTSIDKKDKDIDEYVKYIVEQILLIKTYLDIITNWYDNDWFVNIKEKKDKHPNSEDAINTCNFRNDFIRNHIYEPKWYLYCIYVRTFLDVLKIYLKKEHRDHTKYKEMWESSKYLEYYVHLIFKTGKYKVFNDSKEIIKELEKLTSFLSKPLHRFSIYFNEINGLDENTNQDIDNIVNLILKHGINSDVLKHPINPEIPDDKQEYLKWTLVFQLDESIVKNNLKFWKDKCLEEFDNKVKSEDKNKNCKYTN